MLGLDGITTPMLYFGMWRAMFAIHTEDQDLFSINYLHYGAPKAWYVISSDYAEKFKYKASIEFPQDYQKCKEFLRHKNTMFSPKKLKSMGIPFNKFLQCENEFVITLPAAYHMGFNTGQHCYPINLPLTLPRIVESTLCSPINLLLTLIRIVE